MPSVADAIASILSAAAGPGEDVARPSLLLLACLPPRAASRQGVVPPLSSNLLPLPTVVAPSPPAADLKPPFPAGGSKRPAEPEERRSDSDSDSGSEGDAGEEDDAADAAMEACLEANAKLSLAMDPAARFDAALDYSLEQLAYTLQHSGEVSGDGRR